MYYMAKFRRDFFFPVETGPALSPFKSVEMGLLDVRPVKQDKNISHRPQGGLEEGRRSFQPRVQPRPVHHW